MESTQAPSATEQNTAPVESVQTPIEQAPQQTGEPIQQQQPQQPESQEPPKAADWPEDWREKYAKGDEKALKRLGRYASPQAALDALFNAQNKIASGDLKSKWNPEASDEEKAEWRQQNGIPDTPQGYDTTLNGGMIVGEQDKPIVDAFLAKAHEANMHPDQVKQALSFYFETQEQALNDQLAMDYKAKEICEDQLRAEYGPEFRRNMMAVQEMIKGIPGDVADDLMGGRLGDGTPIMNSPEIIRWLVGMAREINPIGTVVPGSGSNAVQAVESELGNLRKMMGDHKSEYWKGPNSAKNQARYLELTKALQKGR